MYACDDCGAAILAAARRVRELAIDLVCTPHDPKLIVPFFETALTITEVGQKLGIEELNDLSARLVFAARRELSASEDLKHLDSVVTRLTAIAETISRRRSIRLSWNGEKGEFARAALLPPLSAQQWFTRR